MQELIAFVLRWFGRFHVQPGDGVSGVELADSLHCIPKLLRWKLYRQGAKAPMANRLVRGAADASRGSMRSGIPRMNLSWSLIPTRGISAITRDLVVRMR